MSSNYEPYAPSGGSGDVAKGTLKTLGGMVYQWDGTRWYNTGVADTTKTNTPLSFDEQMALATAPRSSFSSSTSSSTSQNFQDPRALDIQERQVDAQITDAKASHDLAVKAQNFTEAKYWQDRLDTLDARKSDYAFQREQQQGQQGFTASENAQNRNLTSSEGAANRALTAQQSKDQQAFTSGESLLSRAQQAGEFAATYAIQKQQAQQAQLAQQLQAAKTYADLSAAPDLTGFKRFEQAGGGVLGNSIAAGATSLTPQGQLGAARALETAQTPATPIPDYVNPYSGIDLTKNPYLAQTTPTPTPQQQYANALGAQWEAAHAAPQSTMQSSAPDVFNQSAPNASGAVQASAPIVGQGVWGAGTASGATAAPGFAYGTDAPPIRREPVSQLPSGAPIDQVDDRFAHGTSHGPSGTFYGRTRYALGTLGRPVQKLGALHVDPNGGGYPPGYAHGTFITGDSTDPNDPAAGGAHPEEIDLTKDANDQPEASVTPLTPPGVGPTEPDGDEGEDPERIAALLRAIADFLDKEDDDEDEQEGAPLGAMGKRFALGTMARYAGGTDDTGLLDPSTTSPLDQQDVSTVLQTRQQTPFSVNPYSLDYQQTSPTARAIDAQSFQTATGVPGSEVAFEADKYKPGGLARGSTYARELDEGV